MIREITLHNFQNHKKLRIKLDKVTVLVGESYAGKSAVVRALRLLTTNKPKGTSYVRHGTGKAVVVCRLVQRGHTRVVKCTRGRSANAYYLDGKKYAPERKRSVPAAIEQLLNLGPVNFQRQDEPHLWLFDSPGQVAKHLNEIADLETMDKVMAHIAKEVRSLTAEVKVVKERLAAARDESKSLAWVPSLVRRFRRLESVGKRHGEILATIARAESLVQTAVGHQSAAERLSDARLAAKKPCLIGGRIAKLAEARTALAELVRRAEANRPVRLPDVGPVIAARAGADAFAERRRELESLIMQAEERRRQWKDSTRQSAGETKRLKKLSRKVCPVCKRPWPSSPAATCTSHRKSPKPGRKKTGTR